MASSNNPTKVTSLAGIATYRAGVVQSTAYRLLKKFTEECVAEYGLTTMQWFIIGTVYDAGDTGIGVTALSKAVDTNVPYITNTLNILEHKNIIVRETREGDNRSKIVKVNPSYIPTVVKIENELRGKMRTAIYANVTPAELQAYLTVLYKLSNSLEKYD